ncbi:MAG: hypothetical protein KF810_15715 [Rhizobiaceae bacterium]|nr:hypothetical protein [Rhizobiaceae bacterium]
MSPGIFTPEQLTLVKVALAEFISGRGIDETEIDRLAMLALQRVQLGAQTAAEILDALRTSSDSTA